MDLLLLTAPCGLDCFNCPFYLAAADTEALQYVRTVSQQLGIPAEKLTCKGCRAHDGRIPIHALVFGEDHRCAAYECSKDRCVLLCGHCDEFPCENLQPCADRAAVIPHNTKVYNLCLINKLGLEGWAKDKAATVRHEYFNKPWSLRQMRTE
jgi:Protein of unknown function (DUF3795)